MFAAAPPLYVVGLLIQLWWIPARLLQLAGWDGLIEHGRDLSTAMSFVGMVALIGASWELVRRSRGRVRIGMVLTLVTNVVGLALQLFQIYAMTSRDLYLEMLDPLSWIASISYVLGVVGLAIAAGRGSLATSLITVVLTVMAVSGLVQRLIFQVGGDGFVFWFLTALFVLRVVLLLIMVTAVAKRCFEPVRDPRRAARRFALLVWLFAARAMFACVMVAVGSLPLWSVGVEAALLALIVVVMWGIAQTQLPQLPRFSMHVGMVGVLISVFLIAEILETLFDTGSEISFTYYREHTAIDIWQVAAAAIGGAFWIVAFWRYGRRAPVIRRKLVVGAIVFAAAIGYEQIGGSHLWVCEAVACVALLPALHAMARALAGDSVQTTADVFA